MVRMIPVERRGKITWVEDAPDVCPAGHPDPIPDWGPCPTCRHYCRVWKCRQRPACQELAVDDEHRCWTAGSWQRR